MGDKEKIVNMCSPDEEGITVLQDRVHDWTDCLRRAFPEYKDMSYAEIADRIGISRGRFFQILGLKLKPKNRIDKRISVPAENEEPRSKLRGICGYFVAVYKSLNCSR